MANVHSGHRARVRERYLREGLDAFEEHQILELLLFYAVPRRDTNELAHRMLKEFGSLAGLMEADVKDIVRRCKVSENTAILISLIPPLSRRYSLNKWGTKPLLNSSEKAGKYAASLFKGRIYEAFYVICLDTQNRVNHADLLHEGTINETPVYTRLVVETALRHQANSVILAHNHPSGATYPSKADLDITKRIKEALSTISVKVLDHVIVGGDNYRSLAEEGLL